MAAIAIVSCWQANRARGGIAIRTSATPCDHVSSLPTAHKSLWSTCGMRAITAARDRTTHHQTVGARMEVGGDDEMSYG